MPKVTLQDRFRSASLLHDSTPRWETLAGFFMRKNPGFRIERFFLDGEIAFPVGGPLHWIWLADGAAEGRVEGAGDASGAWRDLRPGDVAVGDEAHEIAFRGKGAFLRIACEEDLSGENPGFRRLCDLPDTGGGCNVDTNAFRRLQLTWKDVPPEIREEKPDGENRLGCHVVNIAAADSRTHVHPRDALGGGKAQQELYLVLDPARWDLPAEAESGIGIFPESGDWTEHAFVPLRPGDVAAIAPGAAHRAAGVLACVIALPGFKPENEIFLDPRIARESGGRAPHNPAFASP